ncbi:MAG: methyltransferase domain-containing protein [Deltaproteobacteria bacterium]|nr:methyltransferase domain-containing protein [Deltaproteobacteria bacterium]
MKLSRFPDNNLRPDESIDDFMDGRLKVIQPRRGYRFSIDAILLSEFVTIKPKDIVVDLGTGCGIIPLILLLTRPVGYAFGLEIQADLADQAARNAVLNGFDHKMGVILGDIKYPPLAPSSADVVVCNPPYRQKDSGRINPDPQRAIARHEMLASLNDILDAVRRLLKAGGRLAMIYPSDRLLDILFIMRAFDLEPKRIKVVYPGLQSEAKLVLIEACSCGRRGSKILPPHIDQGIKSLRDFI